MSDVIAAWFAGLFDGEGCIAFTGRNSVALSVSMTDRDLVDRILAAAAAGSIYEVPIQGHKTQWVWRLSASGDVRRVLAALLPWFGARRSARAMLALERLNGVRRFGYCKRGHSMAGENLYVSPGGQRQCRACAKIRSYIIKT